jgi:hypothetical protein
MFGSTSCTPHFSSLAKTSVVGFLFFLFSFCQVPPNSLTVALDAHRIRDVSGSIVFRQHSLNMLWIGGPRLRKKTSISERSVLEIDTVPVQAAVVVASKVRSLNPQHCPRGRRSTGSRCRTEAWMRR